MLLTGF